MRDATGPVREVIDREERLCENLKPLGEVVKRAKELHVRCRVVREIEAQAAIEKANRRVAFDFVPRSERASILCAWSKTPASTMPNLSTQTTAR